ncbi:MAG TPA: tetratricopeptide repeat protein [Acidobacteriota bacterium]|nr:tetratricopeptide repeat protein [Acidobacteriota bacterium]
MTLLTTILSPGLARAADEGTGGSILDLLKEPLSLATLAFLALITLVWLSLKKFAGSVGEEAGKGFWNWLFRRRSSGQLPTVPTGGSQPPPAQVGSSSDQSVTVSNSNVLAPTTGGGISAGGNVHQDSHAQQTINVYQGTQPPTAATTFHQLPSDITDFTGREKEIAQLEKLVVEAAVKRKGAVLTSLQGLGGVGKTALAVHVAHKIKDRFPDAQLFINLRGAGTDEQGREILGDPMMPEEALAGLIRPFRPNEKLPDDLPNLSAIFHSALEGKHVLVLLDNAKDAEQVTAICPGAELPDCAVLITSRQSITLPGLDSVNLDVLPENEAVDLLQTICDRIDGDQAKKIGKLCGYLPLALRLAASSLSAGANIPVDQYIERLEREGLATLEHAHQKLAAILNVSVEPLSQEVRTHWARLSVFPGSFEVEGVAAVWEMSTADALPILTDLFQRNLVLWDQKTRRYRLHDLLRLLAREHIEGDLAYSAAHRHAEYYQTVLMASRELYMEGGDKILAGLGIFDVERENIEAGQAWTAALAETDREAASLCNHYPDAGVFILALRLHPRKYINWLESALGAAQTLKDREGEGVHLGNLGLQYAALGEPRRAIEIYEKRLVIAREIGDRRGEGAALGNLGLAWAALGEPRRAIEHHEKALVISREIKDRRAEGQDLGNLGLAWADLGEPRRAIEFYEKRLVIAREIGDRRGEGAALGNLGLVWAALGEPRRAIEFYEQQLTITREIGDRRGEANACWNMGDGYLKLGELERAVGLMQKCVDYEREIGHSDAEKDAAHVDELRRKLNDQSK